MSVPIAPDKLSRLQDLQQSKKFTKERYYPGAPIEQIRLRCERRVNDYLDDIVSMLQSRTERDCIFARARALNDSFINEDTEEREKVEDYIGESMRIIGLEDWTEHV